MFKVNNKDTRCLYCQLWTYFTPSYTISIVNFEQVNAGWEGNFNLLALLPILNSFSKLFYCFYDRLDRYFHDKGSLHLNRHHILQVKNGDINWMILTHKSSQRRCTVKGVLENFTSFTGKHLCESFFLTKLQA